MSATILRLDDHRPDPHCVQNCGEGHVHVFPLAYLETLADPAPHKAEPLPDCLQRMLLQRWLHELRSL